MHIDGGEPCGVLSVVTVGALQGQIRAVDSLEVGGPSEAVLLNLMTVDALQSGGNMYIDIR